MVDRPRCCALPRAREGSAHPMGWGVRAIAEDPPPDLRSASEIHRGATHDDMALPGVPTAHGRRAGGDVSHAAGSEERMIRVLTVDDQAVFRRVARDVIEASPGFESVGQAGSGEHALRIVEELAPDLVLLDVRMPGMSGIEVAARLL